MIGRASLAQIQRFVVERDVGAGFLDAVAGFKDIVVDETHF
jgi:hypothetical protein